MPEESKPNKDQQNKQTNKTSKASNSVEQQTNKSVYKIAAIFVAVVALFMFYKYITSGWGDGIATITIPKDATFEQILDTLEVNNIIRSRASFKILASTTGKAEKIKFGVYKIERGSSLHDVLDIITSNNGNKEKVTFPEGITSYKMASILQRKGITDSSEFVKLASNSEYLKTIGIANPIAEGFLMPDTYFFNQSETPQYVIERLVGEFHSFYTKELQDKAANVGLTSYQAIILASIVEGEARVDDERQVIAGLYLNRLNKGMKLEADPTVQYIVPGEARRLLYKDLNIQSPYNTYRNVGLPPTPINNPSKASILAVLEPKKHNYIFMCAIGDGSGRHTFSVNAAQHQDAVKLYRENLKKVKG